MCKLSIHQSSHSTCGGDRCESAKVVTDTVWLAVNLDSLHAGRALGSMSCSLTETSNSSRQASSGQAAQSSSGSAQERQLLVYADEPPDAVRS